MGLVLKYYFKMSIHNLPFSEVKFQQVRVSGFPEGDMGRSRGDIENNWRNTVG